MDGRGERVRLEFYDWLGWGRKVRDIEIAGGMEGVRRLHNRVRVPTFRYRYGEKSYMGTFSSAGIVEPLIFPSIMSGKCIKVFK